MNQAPSVGTYDLNSSMKGCRFPPFEKGEFQKNHVLFKDDKSYLETMVNMILQYI